MVKVRPCINVYSEMNPWIDLSDRYADCFESWEEIEKTYPNALFGLERIE